MPTSNFTNNNWLLAKNLMAKQIVIHYLVSGRREIKRQSKMSRCQRVQKLQTIVASRWSNFPQLLQASQRIKYNTNCPLGWGYFRTLMAISRSLSNGKPRSAPLVVSRIYQFNSLQGVQKWKKAFICVNRGHMID